MNNIQNYTHFRPFGELIGLINASLLLISVKKKTVVCVIKHYIIFDIMYMIFLLFSLGHQSSTLCSTTYW